MEIGQTLKTKRTAAGLSQEALAEKIGVSRQTVSSWENNRSYPDIGSILKLSDLYGVSLDELLKEDENMRKHMEQTADYSAKMLNWLLTLAFVMYPAGAVAALLGFESTGVVMRIVCWVLIPVLMTVSWKISGGRISELVIGLFFCGIFIVEELLLTHVNGKPLGANYNILIGILMIYGYGDFLGKGLRYWLTIALYFLIPIGIFLFQSLGQIREEDMFYDPELFGQTYSVTEGSEKAPAMVELDEAHVLILDGVTVGQLSELETEQGSATREKWELVIQEDAVTTTYELSESITFDITLMCHQKRAEEEFGDFLWSATLEPIEPVWLTFRTADSEQTYRMDWYGTATIPDASRSMNRAVLWETASAAIRLENDECTELTVQEEYHHDGQVKTRTYTMSQEENGLFLFPQELSRRYEGEGQFAIYSITWENGEYLFRIDFK